MRSLQAHPAALTFEPYYSLYDARYATYLTLVQPDSAEAHTVGANRPLLDQLARDTGGRELRDVGELRRGSGPGPAFALWPWLLGLAIVLFPLDVYLRRRA